MKLITVIEDVNHFGFNLLRLSCALNNLELITLIYNKGDFYSRRIKDILFKDYLENNLHNNDEIILFTDGYDAIFMTDEKEILSKYHKMGKDLVFSAETCCWPDTSLADRYPAVATPYKFLNSGGFIGKVGLIKELINDNSYDLDKFKKSNQYVWTLRFLKNTERITLDSNCEIFCTFSPEIGEKEFYIAENTVPKNNSPYYKLMKNWFKANFVIDGGRIYSKITKTQPCQAHFNGNSKCLLDDDITQMIYGKISDTQMVRYLYDK